MPGSGNWFFFQANIHSFLESDDRIEKVVQYLDDAIQELDNMETTISSYKIHLNVRGIGYHHVTVTYILYEGRRWWYRTYPVTTTGSASANTEPEGTFGWTREAIGWCICCPMVTCWHFFVANSPRRKGDTHCAYSRISIKWCRHTEAWGGCGWAL